MFLSRSVIFQKFHINPIIFKKECSSHNQSMSKIVELINRQIQAEQQAAQTYLKLAVNFLNTKALYHGAGGLFMKMYFEELDHMQGFIKYQLIRGNAPIICGVNAPNIPDNISLLDAFKHSVQMEESVTKYLEEIVTEASDVKDYHCADYVTSLYLKEQIQSINELTHHIIKISSFGSDLHAIHNYDMSLAKQYQFNLDLPK